MSFHDASLAELTEMWKYLTRSKFYSLGFTKRQKLTKPHYFPEQWETAVAILNDKDAERRGILLGADLSQFTHREQVRAYGALCYILLSQAPKRMHFTYDLVQKWSVHVGVNGIFTDTPVHRTHIKAMIESVSTPATRGSNHSLTLIHHKGHSGVASRMELPVNPHGKACSSDDSIFTMQVPPVVWTVPDPTHEIARITSEVRLDVYVWEHCAYHAPMLDKALADLFTQRLADYTDRALVRHRFIAVSTTYPNYPLYEWMVVLDPDHLDILETVRDKVRTDLNVYEAWARLDQILARVGETPNRG